MSPAPGSLLRGIVTAILFIAAVAFVEGCQSSKRNEESPVIRNEEPIEAASAVQGANIPVIYSRSRNVAFAVKPENLEGMAGVELWYTTDGARSWMNHGRVEGKPSEIKFLAPNDGKYGFLRVYVDKAGKCSIEPRHGTTPDQYVVVDTTPPVVETISPNGNEVYKAGATTVVRWLAEDANLGANPVGIEISSNNGQTWVTLARNEANDGSYYMDLPETSSAEYRVRITVTDIAGNVSSDESDSPFVVDGLPPAAQITGPALSTSSQTDIQYSAQDIGGSGLASVKLYYSVNGGATWEYYGEDDNLLSPFKFVSLDGSFGLKLVAVDRMGNAVPPPVPGSKPDATLTVDSTKPQATLMSFNDGGIYAADYAYQILWGARDNIGMPSDSISIAFSNDDGLTWSEIAENIANNGAYRWTTPKVGAKKCRLKICAHDLLKNMAEVVSQPFVVEAAVPEAVVVSPKESLSNSVLIEYGVQGVGESPVKRITLWMTFDNGKTWSQVADDADLKSPIEFKRADGAYGLTVTCVTELGMRTGRKQTEPAAGTLPQLTLTIDSTSPSIALTNFNSGGYFQGGASIELLWEFDDQHPLPNGLSILFSDSGGETWSEVARSIDPRLGKYAWRLPRKSSRSSLFRFSAADSFGNKTVCDSTKVFIVDGDLPATAILRKPDASRLRKFAIAYESKDGTSGIKEVSVYGMKEGGKGRFEKLGSSQNAVGELVVEVPDDGVWEFALIAADMAGNVERESPSGRPENNVKVRIDTIAPTVAINKVKTPDNRESWVNDEGCIEWNAVDEQTSPEAIKVNVEYSVDAGGTWFLLADRQAAKGKYDLHGALREGKTYRFRVATSDGAGNEGSAVTSDFTIESLPRNAILLTALPKDGTPVMGGDCELSWQLKGRAKDIFVEQKLQSDAEWKRIKQVEGSSWTAQIPSVPGTHLYRVAAVDHYGRSDLSNICSITVTLPPPPTLTIGGIVDGEKIEVGKSVKIACAATQGEMKEMWMEVSRGADGWKRRGDWTLDAKETGKGKVRASGKDQYERDIRSNELSFEIILPPPPTLTIGGIADGEKIEVGKSVKIACAATQGEAKEMWMEVSRGADGWKRREDWTLDAKETGKGKVRANGKDQYERDIRSNELSFEIVLPPLRSITIALSTGKAFVGDPLGVDIAAISIPKSASLEIKGTDGAWAKIGNVVDKLVKLAAPAAAGEYRLRVVAVDEYGREMVSNEAKLHVETKPLIKPELALLNFQGGEVIGGGNAKIIFVKAGNGVVLDDLIVEFSTKSGEDGSWERVPVSELGKVKQGFNWNIPKITSDRCRLRIGWKGTDGAVVSAASRGDFAIDSVLPEATALSPSEAESAPVEVRYRLKESLCKVADVSLFYTSDGGKTWLRGTTSPVSAPLKFSPVEQGEYGICLTARNRLNMSSPAPTSGSAPQMLLKYKGRNPPSKLSVKLLPLNGVKIGETIVARGGSDLSVEWNSGSDDPAIKARLFLCIGEKPVEEIARGLTSSGAFVWKVKKEDLAGCVIKVKIEKDGESAWDATPLFRIDNSPPQSQSGFDPIE